MKIRIRYFFKRGVRNHFNWNLICEGFYSPLTSHRLQDFVTLLDISQNRVHVLLFLPSFPSFCVLAQLSINSIRILRLLSPPPLSTLVRFGVKKGLMRTSPCPGPVMHLLWKNWINILTHLTHVACFIVRCTNQTVIYSHWKCVADYLPCNCSVRVISVP